jgi:hypothetical protein
MKLLMNALKRILAGDSGPRDTELALVALAANLMNGFPLGSSRRGGRANP